MKQSLLPLILVLAASGLSRQNAITPDVSKPSAILPSELNITTLSSNQQQQVLQSNLSTIAPATARLLSKPSAPYALENPNQAPGAAGVKDLIFRLLRLNQTSSGAGEQGWSLSGSQGSELGTSGLTNQQASLELRSLLEALSNNNFSSEIRFGDDYSPGMINITISNLRNLTQDGGSDGGANRLFLEELLDESRYPPTFNVSSVMKDNHRFVGRHPTRSKPSSVLEVGSITAVPPIRRTIDVVAENYTTKKIADEANIFALKLVNQLNLERLGNENIIQSPFAIYQGLALLLSGAMGDTSRELDKVLLSIQSVYENTKLTHDQDRSRLMASFGDVVRQLQHQSTNHFRRAGQFGALNCTGFAVREGEESKLGRGDLVVDECASSQVRGEISPLDRMDTIQYRGGSQEQHFIVANNLLFSPSAYEISSEFKHSLNSYYNNTALTRMEIGSTESIQVVNGWIRQATAGLIPAIMSKRSTFDEFNVMTLLSTSWLSQEWLSSFKRVSSSLRSSIRLKGQAGAHIRGARVNPTRGDEPLLEFIDDQKASHFVEYMRSEPSRQIHNYNTILNKQWVDVVVVPFRDSNQRLITITPMQAPPSSQQHLAASAPAGPGGAAASPAAITLNYPSPLSNLTETLNTELLNQGDNSGLQATSGNGQTETSSLSKLLGALALDPRRAMRSLWNTIAPDLITKQTMISMQMARQQQQANNSGEMKLTLRDLIIPPKTQLSMPLFKIEADSTISAALNHVGVVNSFDPAQANFIGINGHPFNYNKLHLSNVIYKTTFNLNEEGINYDRTIRTLEPMRISAQKRQKLKVVVAHEPALERDELVNEVKLNKPFMFLVADIKTKLVLYTGLVRNPAKEISSA